MSSKQKVVIIGCGYAGRSAAMQLDNDFDVTVVDPREKLVHKILIRSAVRPEWVDCMLVPNDNIIKNGKIIKASVKSIDFEQKNVVLSSSTTLSYDYCIIATGAQSKAPVEPPTGYAPHEYFNNVASKISHSNNIVVLGGGPVAIELAGEIKHKHPDSSVTVVSAGPSLCNNMNFPADASDKIITTLKSIGVDTVLNQQVDFGNSSESLVHFHPAKEIGSVKDVDLVINCTGSVPNTQFLPAYMLNARGSVKVDAYLAVPGHAGVFAIGDCNDVAEPKNFVNVVGKDYMPSMPVGHSDVVSANVKALAAGQTLGTYTPNHYVAGIIPCGPTASVTLGFPEDFGKYKSASYFYQGQFQFAKAGYVPPMPSL